MTPHLGSVLNNTPHRGGFYLEFIWVCAASTISFPLAPFSVFSEVDVETSVQIMQSQGSEEGGRTDVECDETVCMITLPG